MIEPSIARHQSQSDCNSSTAGLLICGLFFFLLLPRTLLGDAVMRTQAMFSTTIAQYFVEEKELRLELEIGLEDLAAFRNLLPDAVYAKLEYEPRPLARRLQDFFRHDLVIRADGGNPLMGSIEEIGPRARVVRDEISGTPLPVSSEDAETVIFAVLRYRLPNRPGNLTLLGPAINPRPNVGFVAYHRGIAVNDFRYLTPAQTLQLDWQDPWYSRFDTRALRRTYFAPMSGFIYVEPYEVRKEIIVRPLDLQHWTDLELDGLETIPVAMQEDMLRDIASFLRPRQVVTIDGQTIEPELARINFLERTLTSSIVVDPPRDLSIYSAIVGAIFVYPTEGLPENVTLDWDLFNDRVSLVPAASVDQAGALPIYLEPDYNILEWQNFLKNPELPTLVNVEDPPSAIQRGLEWFRWLAIPIILFVVLYYFREHRQHQVSRSFAGTIAIVGLLVAIGLFTAGRAAEISNQKAGSVIAGLLHNVYRAFDFRDETRIYDTLDHSVAGDLLDRIYLETRRGLVLQNQGGARAKVKDIELIDVSARRGEDGSFIAETAWNVHGSVGHWGHVHRRSNRYLAELHVSSIDGQWKLTDLEIIEEERL